MDRIKHDRSLVGFSILKLGEGVDKRLHYLLSGSSRCESTQPRRRQRNSAFIGLRSKDIFRLGELPPRQSSVWEVIISESGEKEILTGFASNCRR